MAAHVIARAQDWGKFQSCGDVPGCRINPILYADYGTQRQEVAIPRQHGRIEAGRAAAVQKQGVLTPKHILEETRELAKRNF